MASSIAFLWEVALKNSRSLSMNPHMDQRSHNTRSAQMVVLATVDATPEPALHNSHAYQKVASANEEPNKRKANKGIRMFNIPRVQNRALWIR